MYKYQLHTHTTPTSKCSHMTPAELALALHNAGYAGCVVTNHFMHGNTGIGRDLPWEEFVAAYERDYLECKREGEKYGLDVIFGIEEGIGGPYEVLCYGVTPEMLYAHPELAEYSAEVWYRVMHSLGVLVIQAHPYRVVTGVPDPHPISLDLLDGIEVYNHGNRPEYNENARRFAEGHGELILTSGADTHTPDTVGFGGILTRERITDGDMLRRVLLSGDYELLTP